MPISSRSTAVSIVGLQTEFIESPMGVETTTPLLSWQLASSSRGIRQSAYRIEVATSIQLLQSGKPDLWDSGRVASDASLNVPYAGAPLSSRQCCYWRVHIWNEDGVASPPSEVARWEMGLLEPSDWSAKWLAAESQAMRKERPEELRSVLGPMPPEGESTKFRLRFSTRAAGTGALYLTANGNCTIWVDGQVVERLSSSAAPIAIPVTLTAGQHVLAIAIEKPDAILFSGAQIAPFLRAHMQDGSLHMLSFAGWKTALSTAEGWHNVEFDDRGWNEPELSSQPYHLPWPKESAVLLRRLFSTKKPLERARIYATALGAYDLYLNGQRVSDALLASESTDFRKRALYRVYDVTNRIVTGENVVGAIVGDGWYGSSYAFSGRYPWGPPPRRARVQLELRYADGSRDIIGTDAAWQISRAPIVSSEIYDGEDYDARLEQPDWLSPGFDASHWEAAVVGQEPHIMLTCQIGPPIRREQTLSVHATTEIRPGVFIFDFGQNFAGWCRLNVTGAAGTIVEMQFAEVLQENGDLDRANLGEARASDTYILKGDPKGETFEPHFTYHGFRYVQVTGLPSAPTAKTLEGIVLHSDLPMTGTLNIDNALIQTLWRNTLWSQRSNFVGIPTDCPQRAERLGWMGDANVFWDAAAFNMDVDAFTHRFMNDVRDTQAENGAFSDISPAPWKASAGVLPGSEPDPGYPIGSAAGWSDAGVCLPWTVWQRYGDTSIIDENWEAMERYIRFIAEANPDFVWRRGRGVDYGDWLALDAKQPWDPTTPKDLIATATWAYSVACMAEMAQATSRTKGTTHYRDMWAKIAAAFRKDFIASDGTVGNGSQTGYILALHFNLVPSELRTAAAAKLAEDIRQRGTLLSTGFLGTPYSLDVLADAGYSELVYSLLLRTDFPSWGHMVAQGATTIWERWNSDMAVKEKMNSYNHYALGAVCGFLFRRVAAISPLEPSFRKIQVWPLLDPRVKKGGGVYHSIRGKIATSWEQLDGGGFTLDLTVPPNATARVYLPAKNDAALLENGHPLSEKADIVLESRTNDHAILNVRSGDYRFAVV